MAFAGRALRKGTRWIARAVLAASLVLAASPTSIAQDVSGLTRDLSSGADFRLRVGAALSLGKTHSVAALEPLLKALLEDTHPAVRTAAAAALGALGDTNALPGLKAALAREGSAAVKSQIKAAIDALDSGGAGGSRAAATMLVQLGQMKNNSGVRGAQLADVLRGATKSRAAEIPGVEVLADDADAAREAQARKLPVVVLDGSVNRLAQGAQGPNLVVSAQVEYIVRKMPEHALKGSVSGAAQALGHSAAAKDKAKVARLQDQALAGAVESAMRGAPSVLQQAVR